MVFLLVYCHHGDLSRRSTPSGECHGTPDNFSEFGGGAKYGLHGDKNQRWTEEFQENLYRENCAMLDKIDGLAGTTPWIPPSPVFF